jgi:hypothetical protein
LGIALFVHTPYINKDPKLYSQPTGFIISKIAVSVTQKDGSIKRRALWLNKRTVPLKEGS